MRLVEKEWLWELNGSQGLGGNILARRVLGLQKESCKKPLIEGAF